jgi:hypothetical protein
MNLNRNQTIRLIQCKQYWYQRHLYSKRKIYKPRVEAYYFGIFSKKN